MCLVATLGTPSGGASYSAIGGSEHLYRQVRTCIALHGLTFGACTLTFSSALLDKSKSRGLTWIQGEGVCSSCHLTGEELGGIF